MRTRSWIVLNVLIPGTGLVVVRREWLGLSIALLFTVLVQIALIGAMITPALVPRWAIIGAGFGAVVVWAAAQWRFRLGLREVTDPAAKLEIQSLRRRARQAVQVGEIESALQLLTVATELDDEDPETWAARAEVLARLDGQPNAGSTACRLPSTDHQAHPDEAPADSESKPLSDGSDSPIG